MQCLNTTATLFPQENKGVIGSMIAVLKVTNPHQPSLLAEMKDMQQAWL